MKKVLATLTLALGLIGTASAVEVGVNGSYDMGGSNDRPGAGVTLGEKFGKFGVTAGFDRYTKGNDTSKYSLVGSYDIAQFAGATFAVKAGAAYIDNSNRTPDGYAALVGAGASYPITKEVALTADYRYQAGQSRINQYNGSTVAFGAKYSF
jgi:outer membrane autotransporter protein